MFFILSKTVSHLFMPLTLIVGSLLLAQVLRNLKWKKRLRYFGLGLLIICSNPFLTNSVLKLWEVGPLSMDLVTPKPAVGIVLTGVTKKEKKPQDRVYFYEGADRVTHAIQLYKTGKIEKIIISGANSNLFKPGIKEAQQLEQVFLLCGVPPQDLVIEDESRNTHESAIAVAKILKSQFPENHYLLITSAFHMRRSLACFSKAGVLADGFSTDFKTSDEPPSLGSFFIPSSASLGQWHILVREWMGFVAYFIAGYI